jgi:ssDNA-binding Zn-finger/Zn-ribbon topoisomerase 1
MTLLLIVVFVLLAIIGVFIFLNSKGEISAQSFPYEKQAALFTPAERSFFGLLEQAVGNEYRIFGKIRLADVVSVRRGLSSGDRQRAQNRINAKHLDFVLCNKGDLSLACCIELDDKSHAQKKTQDRDQLLENVMKAASVPLIRVKAQTGYNVQTVRNEVEKATGRKVVDEGNISEAKTEIVNEVPVTKGAAKLCPNCSSAMTRRRATKGEHAGKEFWGCVNYPKCKTIIPVVT